jgi:hypothetical protein
VRNPVGAGDSFAAGLAVELADGAPLPDAVRTALAAAAANVETDVAGMVDPRRVRELAEQALVLDERAAGVRYLDPGDDDVVGGARGRTGAGDA